MKARTRNTWRLARLNWRLSFSQQVTRAEHRDWRAIRNHTRHHEPIHEAKQRPAQPRKPAPRPQQAPDMWPDMSILALAAQTKRKRMVR